MSAEQFPRRQLLPRQSQKGSRGRCSPSLRGWETKPQVTLLLKESLENVRILAKMSSRDDAQDFRGTSR